MPGGILELRSLSEAAVGEIVRIHGTEVMRCLVREATKPYQDKIVALEEEITALRSTIAEHERPRGEECGGSAETENSVHEAGETKEKNPERSSNSSGLKRTATDLQLVDLLRNGEYKRAFVLIACVENRYRHFESASVLGVFHTAKAAKAAAEKYAIAQGFNRNNEDGRECSHEDAKTKPADQSPRYVTMSSKREIFVEFFTFDGASPGSKFEVSIHRCRIEFHDTLPKKGKETYLTLFRTPSDIKDIFTTPSFTVPRLSVCSAYLSRRKAERFSSQDVKHLFEKWNNAKRRQCGGSGVVSLKYINKDSREFEDFFIEAQKVSDDYRPFD